MIQNYKKYLYKNYLNSFLKVSLVFFSISIIMNLFEGKKTIDEIYDILFIKLPITEFILENYASELLHIQKSCWRYMLCDNCDIYI